MVLLRSPARLPLTEQQSDGAVVRARVIDVSKAFGRALALSGVSIDFRAGEVHAILGENGAGKTTLVRILSGILAPDSGHLEIAGKKVVLRARKDGAVQRIGIVQQQDGLVKEITGVDNYLLDRPGQRLWLNRSHARNELLRAAEKLGLSINPDALVAELSIGERQRLEIVIALMIGADVIIFDEPTAALLTNDVRVLVRVIRRLAEQGRSVIYITHKLDEVMEIADRVTVLRRGLVVGRFDRAHLDKSALIAAMVGSVPEKLPANPADFGEVVIELRDVSVVPSRHRCGLRGASLTVRRREIVGIAGVVGNGQETLAEVLRGLAVPEGGELRHGSDRVAFVPEDRARDGLAMTLSIADNLMVYRHKDPAFRARGRLLARAVADFVQETVDRTGVALQSIGAPAKTLSGGNQQKLVIAREFDRQPDLVVAHNPYRGLDVAAAAAVRRLLLQARDAGAAIVLISPDLEDLFDISDRILFLSNGRVTGAVDPRATTLHALGNLLGGALS
jgi:general nucleoside transport system ATP-binding protein